MRNVSKKTMEMLKNSSKYYLETVEEDGFLILRDFVNGIVYDKQPTKSKTRLKTFGDYLDNLTEEEYLKFIKGEL